MFSLKLLTFYNFLFYILVVKLFIFFLQVVVAKEAIGNLGGMVRQLSLDQFENESRRMIPSNDLSYPTKKFSRQKSPQGLHKKVCRCSTIKLICSLYIYVYIYLFINKDFAFSDKTTLILSPTIQAFVEARTLESKKLIPPYIKFGSLRDKAKIRLPLTIKDL